MGYSIIKQANPEMCILGCKWKNLGKGLQGDRSFPHGSLVYNICGHTYVWKEDVTSIIKSNKKNKVTKHGLFFLTMVS